MMKLNLSNLILLALFLITLTIPGYLSKDFQDKDFSRSLASSTIDHCFNLAVNLVQGEPLTETSLKEFVDSYELRTSFAELYPQNRINNRIYRSIAYDEEGIGKNGGVHVSSSFKYLKKINDHVNKSFGTAIENFNKGMFFDHLEKTPSLLNKLQGSYFDYKGHREVFKNLSAGEIDRLNKIFLSVIRQQSEMVESIPELKAILKNSNLPPPDQWHRIGVGPGPDKANFAAKMSEFIPNAGAVTTYAQAKEHAPVFLSRIRSLESKIFAKNKFVPGMMNYDPMTRESYLSLEACAVLRKVDGEKSGLIKRFKNRFDVNLSGDEAQNILDYFHYTDIFSPELVIAERTMLDLSGRLGVISADMAGMGAKNAESLMRAIRSTGLDVEATLRASRISEVAATKEYMNLLHFYDRVIRESGLYSMADLPAHSGDDIAIKVVDIAFESEIDKRFRTLVSLVAENPDYINALRLVRCPGVYIDDMGVELGQEMVNAHIVDTEQVIKKTRILCENAGLYNDCRQLVLASRVSPYKGGNARYDLIVGGKLDSSSSLTREKLSSFFEEAIQLAKKEAQVPGEKLPGKVTFLD